MKTLRYTALLGVAAALMVTAKIFGASADTQIQNLRGLQLKHAKIPVLNQEKLQMVIFASSAERRGEMLVGLNTVLSIIRRGADADKIRDDWDLAPYPLGAPLPQVLDFWKDPIAYSEGIMNTPEAEIDNTGRRASGNRDVHFRSPQLDLDGVGFEADFRRRTISVNSQVRIVLRQESANPEELLKTPGKLPAKYEYVTASGDSMLIDTRRNEVMLVGNVRVAEAQAILTCDRLTIFWKTGSQKKKSEKKSVESELQNSGIDRVLADGNVIISKRDNPREQVLADHLICEVPTGMVKLSGDTEFPKLVSANGEVLSGRDILFERDTRRGSITGGCRIDGAPETDAKGKKTATKGLTADRGFFDSNNNFAEFSGNVRMRDGGRTISCARLRINTADRKATTAAVKAAQTEAGTGSLLGSPDIGTGGKNLRSADFYDKVVLSEPGGAKLSCDRMHADFAPGGGNSIKSADFHGHVEMKDPSNSKLNCEEMHADFAPGSGGGTELAGAQWFRNVRVENAGGDGTPPGVITADRGELDVPGNRVTFESNVNGKRDKATLKCDRLDLYVVAKKGDAAKTPSGSAAIGVGGDRVIRKIVTSGRTHITDESGSLDCDKLTLFFDELPPGAKPEPGMLQSGGARLTDILADGHVVAVNRASADSKKAPGILSGKSSGTRRIYADHIRADLTRHLSRLHGSVRIKDDENRLDCDEMYLYGVRKLSGLALPKRSAVAANDPDADPFALPGFNEDSVPAAINITDDVQLKKILCLGNVKMERTDPDTKRKQEAGGNRCVYLTNRRIITLTDTPPRRPWLRAEGRQQYGSKIVYDLNDNIFTSYDTDTFTVGP